MYGPTTITQIRGVSQSAAGAVVDVSATDLNSDAGEGTADGTTNGLAFRRKASEKVRLETSGVFPRVFHNGRFGSKAHTCRERARLCSRTCGANCAAPPLAQMHDARCAGSHPASVPTVASTTAEATSVIGSRGSRP
jgi:hypothetical protein